MTDPAIDGCIVINLPQRTDRWALLQKQIPLLNSLGLNQERLDAIYGRDLPGYEKKPWFRRRHSEKRDQAWAGKAGCTLSHRNAIALAKARGWKNVLILEDDVKFDNDILLDQINCLYDCMRRLPDDWIAIYLYGHRPIFPIRVVQKYPQTTCYELHGAITTAAYIVNGRYFGTLLKLLPEGSDVWGWTARHKTIDRWYSRQLCILGRVFAFEPFGVITVDSPSDVATAGLASSSQSFQIMCVTNKFLFYVARIIRFNWNSFSLFASIIRQYLKKIKGL